MLDTNPQSGQMRLRSGTGRTRQSLVIDCGPTSGKTTHRSLPQMRQPARLGTVTARARSDRPPHPRLEMPRVNPMDRTTGHARLA